MTPTLKHPLFARERAPLSDLQKVRIYIWPIALFMLAAGWWREYGGGRAP